MEHITASAQRACRSLPQNPNVFDAKYAKNFCAGFCFQLLMCTYHHTYFFIIFFYFSIYRRSVKTIPKVFLSWRRNKARGNIIPCRICRVSSEQDLSHRSCWSRLSLWFRNYCPNRPSEPREWRPRWHERNLVDWISREQDRPLRRRR